MTRTLVIGGSGFTGRQVLACGSLEGEVFATARSLRAGQVISGLGATPVAGDLEDVSSIQSALLGVRPTRVIVVASLGFGHAADLVATIESAGSPRCVFTSTTGIFTSLNPASKKVRVAAEESIVNSSLDYTIVRPTMIYGLPGDRNMERLLRSLRRFPLVFAPNGGTNLQQPVHVDDLAKALVAAASSEGASRRAINVPGPRPLAFHEVATLAAQAVGRSCRVISVPSGTLRSLVSLQESVLPRPLLKAEQIDRLVEDKVFDVHEAATLLDHRPRSFPDGIEAEARALGLRSDDR